ncbi:MAG: LPS export ABC transporter permease LptF [Pseudohongiellaceae bacterium]
MIIFRYLSKQILQVMAAVTVILLVVALTQRFIQYLGQAVAGELASNVLALLMLYRLPDFLLVILPLAFFLGILLAYGRMYAENEMTVLVASGLSQKKLLGLTMASAAIMVGVITLLSLHTAPWGIGHTERLKQSQEELTELDLIVAGQFQSFADGNRVTYAEQIGSTDRGRQLDQVFVALRGDESSDGERSIRIILSDSARPEVDEASGRRFMRLDNVLQYEGIPGEARLSVGQFDVQSILLPEPAAFEAIDEERAVPTMDLLSASSLELQAELQWRISLILIVPVITLIAVPLSKVSPRAGRYSKLVPATLLYASYYILLQVSRDLVADGSLPPAVGLWWVHVAYAVLGIMAYRNTLMPTFQIRRARG